ncbi:hypothetical protein Pla52o_29300 [Novipirellula galeiformis]|uniref:Uncharacterized protein n=1 Tax=Novipirellula galeiformis TaxID=2528004 RepID=A0A5C6CIX8_9BACT|nr:hypothetical protein Pla52o_29300 [Novipirellula galeiformis]
MTPHARSKEVDRSRIRLNRSSDPRIGTQGRSRATAVSRLVGLNRYLEVIDILPITLEFLESEPAWKARPA